MKCGEMKHEMTLFHTMGPNRNVLFQTHLLSVTIYGLMCDLQTSDDSGALQCVIGDATSLYLVVENDFYLLERPSLVLRLRRSGSTDCPV